MFAATIAVHVVAAAGTWASPGPVAAPAAAASTGKRIWPERAGATLTINVRGQRVRYAATVEALPLRDPEGNVVARASVTSYSLVGGDPRTRPITVAYNGGPGSASAALNLMALGPRRLLRVDDGGNAVETVANQESWLPFTDLVFIDAIGTGFGRPTVQSAEARTLFYNVAGDAKWMANAIYQWLLQNGRVASPKYIVGESYGGFRTPLVALNLQDVAPVDGIVMISPLTNTAVRNGADVLTSPVPWIVNLPTIAAGHLAKAGKSLDVVMPEIERYARTDYAVDLLAGWNDAALRRMSIKLADFTGLPEAYLEAVGSRLDAHAALRRIDGDSHRLAPFYDIRNDIVDPFPWIDGGHFEQLASADTPLSQSAMAEYYHRTFGWSPAINYLLFNPEVNATFDWGSGTERENLSELRVLLAKNRRMRVLIAHGYFDLGTPYYGSALAVATVPPELAANRIALRVYPGGHMFYEVDSSRTAFTQAARSLYRQAAWPPAGRNVMASFTDNSRPVE